MAMSIASTFSVATGLAKRRFAPLLGILASYFLIQIALMGGFFIAMGSSLLPVLAGISPGVQAEAGPGAGFFVGLFVFYLLLILLSAARAGSMCAMATPLRDPGFGDAVATGVRRAPTLLGVFVLLLLGYVIAALLFAILAGVLSLLGAVGAVISVVATVGALFYVVGRLAVVIPVVAVEDIGNPISAIKRSLALTRGYVLKIIGVFVLFGLAAGVLLAIVLVPLVRTVTSAQALGEMPDLGTMGGSIAGFMIIGVILSIAGAAIQSALHAELSGSAGGV